MISRNTPLPITPHNGIENRVAGLRDFSVTPLTYRKYQQQPNGTVVYIGEFPTLEISYKNSRRKVNVTP